MTNGKYVYCVLEGKEKRRFEKIGLFGNDAYTISYKDINAVVSEIPFKEMQPTIEHIASHQQVVEASRNVGATLPVRFGIIFKTEDGVKNLLLKSYKDFKAKIIKLRNKNEFGLKIILDNTTMKKIRDEVVDNSEEIKKIKKEISKSGEGTSYLLKMRIDDAIKTETLRKIDTLSDSVHQELVKCAEDSCMLKNDLEQIILNAAYLIDKSNQNVFIKSLQKLESKYERDGLKFHTSGPWAPYSFC